MGTAPAVAALLLAGCQSGSSAGDVEVRVAAVATPSVAAGEVEVEFLLQSDPASSADVDVLYSADGGQTWRSATLASGAVDDLASSPAGVRHRVAWDSLRDVGFRVDRPMQVVVEVRDAPAVSGGALAAKGGGGGPASTVEVENLQPAAAAVQTHLYYLGAWTAADVAVAEQHDLVVLAPQQSSVTPQLIAEIQDGVDPADPTDDVIVLGQLVIGQDLRTVGLSEAQMLADPRFVGDGSGPRVDPRGPGAAGQSLEGLPLLGSASVSGGYASWYLDDNSVETSGVGDGIPDRSGYTLACYVNAGDPAWYAALDSMLLSADGVAGIREQLTTTTGSGFGCDGLFVDRIDTCSPNFYTGPGVPNQVEFEWTAPGFTAFMHQVRTDHPEAVIMQNRGLFFFDPNLPHYKVNPRAHIDLVGFSSYRLDAATWREYDAYFFADNKHNVLPKLRVEADRPDGFQVLSIGHAAGPGIDPLTLVGASTDGLATLLQDVVEAQRLAGMRHYLTDAGAGLVNAFVRDNADLTDTDAPVWSSTYNDNNGWYPTPPSAPTPRVGVQEVAAQLESATVRWDVALDLNPVHYAIYYADSEMTFDANGVPSGTRLEVAPQLGAGYAGGASPSTFPYEAVIGGLRSNRFYWFCVRAVDSLGNEDQNQVQLSAKTLKGNIEINIDGRFQDWHDVPMAHVDGDDVPDSAGPNWLDIKAHNDADNLYLYFRSAHNFDLGGAPYSYSRTLIMVDVDNNPFSGWSLPPIGSELLIAGDRLYTQTASVFADQDLGAISVNPTKKVTQCEMAVPLSHLDQAYGQTAHKIRLVFVNDDAWDVAPDYGYVEFDLTR